MPNTQKFDGPVLADLLAQVGRLGPGARILKAERKRSGGMGGFFAKEWYELTVEVSVLAAVAAAPASIVAMAEAVSADERRETFGEVLQRVGADAHLVDPTGGMPTAEEFVAAAQARLAALPESQSAVVAETDPVAAQNVAAMASVRHGRLPSTPASYLSMAPPAPAPEPIVMPVPLPVPPAPEVLDARTFVAAATSGLDRQVALQLIFDEAPVTTAPAGPFAAVVDDLARRTETVEAEPVIAHVRERLLVPTLSTETDSFKSVLGRLAQQADLAADRADLLPALAALGVPEHLLPRAGAGSYPLLELPPAPGLPSALGTIIAVVGTRLAAGRLARALARELGRDDDDVMIASPTGESHVRMRDDLDSLRAACRRPWVPATVVALGTPIGGRHVSWGRTLLDGLAPDLVLGVIDADRKTEDVAAWAHDLGGLDALALERLDATVTPAAALALGIPVARLDGRPATPEAWDEILTKRLAVAA